MEEDSSVASELIDLIFKFHREKYIPRYRENQNILDTQATLALVNKIKLN